MPTAEDIYRAYPKHVGKIAAIKAIGKAIERIEVRIDNCTPGWLLGRVEAYAATRKGHPRRFTPNPTTWFNQGRYDDDPEDWQESTAKPDSRPGSVRDCEGTGKRDRFAGL